MKSSHFAQQLTLLIGDMVSVFTTERYFQTESQICQETLKV